jgi:hypothetical protein
MVKMLMIMHHSALCTPCIALFNCYRSFAYMGRSRGGENGDPKRSKSKEYLEVHNLEVEEDTNLALDQGKPRCI